MQASGVLMKWMLLFLLLSFPLGALEIHGEFQVGHDTESPLAFTYILLEVIQAPVTLYGSWRTWFEFDMPSGYPFRDIYTVGAELTWGNVFFDVNHFCNHAVYSPALAERWQSNVWGETITTVSIGVRW